MRERLSFTWVDVFAPHPLCGNQLAVFRAPADLPVAIMKQLTRELNHSETTFLQPPTAPGADLRVRIFIPTLPDAAEIPFAGHPILGSAVVAAMDRAAPSTVHVEAGVGVVPVSVEPVGAGRWEARMLQPVPRVVATLGERAALAGALGLTESDLQASLPVEAVDNGMQTVVVPLVSLDAVGRAVPDMPALRSLLGRAGLCTLVFAPGGKAPDAAVTCRVFSPFDLVAEDPATGSANGPLGEYMVRHGLARAGAAIRSEQGDAVGRPGRLVITVEREGDSTRAVYVGGQVLLVGRGEFLVDRTAL
jgi:trans-2,3-dihydro-3-hydroxyanthranilate isomerase